VNDKHIDTLVEDIQKTLTEGVEGYDNDWFGRYVHNVFTRRVLPDNRDGVARVWFSNVGGPCVRKLWYKLHASDRAEPLHPNARLKFLYGDIIEGLVLELARASGHDIACEQKRVEWNGITGRIDAIIDGVLVDVKSASSHSFKKFRGGLKSEDDSFGYIGQLGGYLLALKEIGCEELKEKNKAAYLVIDKVNGALHLDVHEFSDEYLDELHDILILNKDTAENETEVPERAFHPVPEGKSGNMVLSTNCSYCDFKKVCWPSLRTFMYSGNKPKFFTEIIKEPKVPEIIEEGDLDDGKQS